MAPAAWQTRPNAPAAGEWVCQLGEIIVDGGLEKVFGQGERAFRLVVFRVDGQVRGYVNECPHFRVPFNFNPGIFNVYDIDGQRDLMCAHHTAMFHLADGFCYEGPCAGGSLLAVPLRVAGDSVLVA